MKHVIILIAFVLPVFSCFSQQLTPPIQNFSSLNYEAASQNWDITIDQQGLIFAANNQGLLSFDGQQWDLHPLQTGSIIRSVYAHENRIYTGSYQEFGYWARDNTGELKYTSLMPLLGEYQMQSEEFWEILSYNGAIYFRSFGAIYRYKDEEIKPVRNVVTHKMTVYQDRLLIAGPSGLFYLEEDGEIEALPNQEILEDKVMIDIAIKGDNLLIGTREALYVFDGESFRPYFDQDVNNLLSRYELNHILVLDDKEFVLGTTKNGIIHYDEKTEEYNIFSRNNGLQNNTVLGMAEKNGSIWLGLDNGIDRIDLEAPVKVFTDDSGQLGAVYDLAFYENETYLASNTGVYHFTDEGIEMIRGSAGHTWNLEVLNGKLFVNHNTGTYIIKEGRMEPVEERTGSFQVLNVPGKPGLDFIGTYTGITGATKDGKDIYMVNGINFPVKEIIFENRTTLWAAHPYEGIYRIKLDPNFETAVSLKKVKDIDGHGHYNANIYKINNQLAILNNNQWYKYNSFSGSLEVFKELKPYENHKILLEDTNGYWFTNTSDNSIKFSNFKDPDVILSSPKLTGRLVKNHEKLIQYNDSIYYVALNDGFAQINLNELLRRKDQETLGQPIVRGFSDMEQRYDLTAKPKVPFRNARDINVQTALPVSDASGLHYELIGTDTIEGKVEESSLNFQNLPHGEYQLNLFALSPQHNSSAITSFVFSVNPPWYLSWPMRLMYFLLAFGLIAFIYRFNQLKLRKQQLLLEQKFEKEHKERLNHLEKERLMNEITLKRKELANTTMVAAKKNEVLMEIQGELNRDKSNFSNQFRLKHIMNKINKAVKNKDEWQVFETNFNELHEDFFKDLLGTYPQLSSKDLKLCAYLKMNLTSKEIAPLMGISVRGVEVHRYRLRKKMGLDKKENLTNFLIKNF